MKMKLWSVGEEGGEGGHKAAVANFEESPYPP